MSVSGLGYSRSQVSDERGTTREVVLGPFSLGSLVSSPLSEAFTVFPLSLLEKELYDQIMQRNPIQILNAHTQPPLSSDPHMGTLVGLEDPWECLGNH